MTSLSRKIKEKWQVMKRDRSFVNVPDAKVCGKM